MQPMLVQVPPSAGLPSGVFQSSMQAVARPSCAARIAATYPPGPPPMTTTSNVCAMDSALQVEKETRRIFERFLDRDQRQHRFAAVDDAVIVGEREVVDRPNDDLAVLNH